MSLKEKARIKYLEVRVYELELRQKVLFKLLEKVIKALLEAGIGKALEMIQ